MRWNIVSPPVWYMAFWLGMLCGLYFVVKWAVIAAEVWRRNHPV